MLEAEELKAEQLPEVEGMVEQSHYSDVEIF